MRLTTQAARPNVRIAYDDPLIYIAYALTHARVATHSVGTVIDYVTVYRAHTSRNKEEGCGRLPFLARVPSLHAPLHRTIGNSVTTASREVFSKLKSFSKSLPRARPRRFSQWPKCSLAFCASLSAKCNLVDAVMAGVRFACACVVRFCVCTLSSADTLPPGISMVTRREKFG